MGTKINKNILGIILSNHIRKTNNIDMRLIYVSIKIFIGIIIYVGYYCCYVKKNCPKAKFNSKVIRYCI
jgi:hypothetical protein